MGKYLSPVESNYQEFRVEATQDVDIDIMLAL